MEGSESRGTGCRRTRSAVTVETQNQTNQEDHEPETKRRRVRLSPNKQRSESPGTSGATAEDWTQNLVVVQAVCEHMPFKDVISARLVCKLWAIAGAVPLSHKAIVAVAESKGRMQGIKKNPVLATGFRLRHVSLDWGAKATTPRDEANTLMQSWLDLFRSEEFKLVESLRIRTCPSEIIAKLLLPNFLPQFWKKLTILDFASTVKAKAGSLETTTTDEQQQPQTLPNLELEEFGLDLDILSKTRYSWEFLKKCSKLKKLRILVTDFEDYDPDTNDEEENLRRTRLVYKDILAALEGKKLTNLEFGFNPMVFSEGELYPTTVEMKAFFDQLLSMNQSTLEYLTINAEIQASVVRLLFVNLPWASQLPRLKSVRLNCTGMHELEPDRQSIFLETFLVFQVKGYLKLKFALNVTKSLPPLFRASDYEKISFAGEPSGKLAVKFDGNMNHLRIHFDGEFVYRIRQAYPNVNYLCMPMKQRLQLENQETVETTALFERLHSSGLVFDLHNADLLFNYYDKLEDRKGVQIRIDKKLRSKLDVSEFDLVSSHALADVKLNWPDFDETNEGVLFTFGVVPDLEKALAKARRSTCKWTTMKQTHTGPRETDPCVLVRLFDVAE